MDESALDRYFDNFIVNDPSKMEKQEVNEESGDELFFSLLPDELYQEDAGTVSWPMPELDASPVRLSTPVMPEILPQIQNVTSTVKLGCCLDLNVIACKAWNVEYNPKTYKALIMRIRQPRTTALIYKSGNIVCTGAKSVEGSRLAARKYTRIVQKLGFPAHFLNFKIHNLVASCNSFPVSLERLAHHHDCSYEPELFPGLHYKGVPGITVSIFSSGKMSLSGN
ncbi:uncharacterized protein LOC127373860 [Dicentrarchus labrax]|uniref:uncharacterized protein LOC127373860 n=1 Tax=Dicentrarchus labrax TaxID=13489 RepID=UPI0021F57D12|nr:uncharacterized protein LOC127373860 [Dicentrarchus labrax]